MSIQKMQLRDYQTELETKIHTAWQTSRNVLAVLPCGGGKTNIFSKILNDHTGASCVIAHRKKLISQISLTLASWGVYHKIIAPKEMVKWIIGLHVAKFGKNYHSGVAPCAVATVKTLGNRKTEYAEFYNQVSLWVVDEAAHVLRGNTWGKAVNLFPNAKGLGVTATPCRADGKGLGRHADGVFDTMVQGPTMRWLIDAGYLCDYRIFCPPNDLNLTGVNIGASGEFSPKPLKQRVRESTIMGDIVGHYLKIAPGAQGITFVTDVETASDIALQFKTKGVSAEVLHAKTPDNIYAEVTRRLESKQIQQITNVDIFGEGVDVPEIAVVSLGRPTSSLALYIQQCGRPARISPGKLFFIIVDHVGNVMRHGLPDTHRAWTLDRRDKRASNKSVLIPIKVCPECTSPYEATHSACPFCGYVIIPADRSKPEYVDGDLTELSPDVLAAMRGEVARIDAPESDFQEGMKNSSSRTIFLASKQHRKRQEAQQVLRESIAWWSGHHPGTLAESYRRFYFTFGIDVMSAKALGRPDAEKLTIQINMAIDAQINGG